MTNTNVNSSLETLKIIVVGAGRVSYSILHNLKKKKIIPYCIVDKDLEKSKEYAALFKASFYSDNFKYLEQDCFCILSVPDNEIKKIASKIAKLKLNFDNLFFIHTSGSHTIDDLSPLSRLGAGVGSFHPMQTFPNKKVVSMKGVVAGIEFSNASIKKILLEFCNILNTIPIELNKEQKEIYHLMGVFASNFLIGNLFLISQLSQKYKIPIHSLADSAQDTTNTSMEKDLYNFLKPILMSTLKNIEELGISAAVSGPIERGDVKTIVKHLKKLKNVKNPFYPLEITSYIVQSFSLLKLLENKEIEISENQKEIFEVLKNEFLK